jgi:hypothetical protein
MLRLSLSFQFVLLTFSGWINRHQLEVIARLAIVILPPIPHEPRPPESAVGLIMSSLSPYWLGGQRELRRYAEFRWRCWRKEVDPNAFQVAFPPADLDYRKYLKSHRWKSIKKKVLARDRQSCRGCGRKATCVHHRDYRPRVLSGEDISLLVSLCHECHHYVHSTRSCWNDAEARLLTRIAKFHTSCGNS